MTKRAAQATIRLMVVHDHLGVRTGLAAFLGHVPDIEVVSATTCGRHVLDTVAELHPDLVLMQRSWGGIEMACRLIEADPDTRVAIISTAADAQCRTEAAQSGALGVVDLTAPPAETASVLRRLVRETPKGPVELHALTAARVPIFDCLDDVAQDLTRIATSMSDEASEWRAAGANGKQFELLDRSAAEVRDTVKDVRSLLAALVAALTPVPLGSQPLDPEHTDAELRRFARELYDGPLQGLLVTQLQLSAEASSLRREALGQEGELLQFLETAGAEVRQARWRLRNPTQAS